MTKTTILNQTRKRTEEEIVADQMQKAREYQRNRYHTDAAFREHKKKMRQQRDAARRVRIHITTI